MKTKNTLLLSFASALLVTAAVMITQAQSNSNRGSSTVQQEVSARLKDIQNAAEALDPDKVFSFVLENNQGALAQNGELFLTRAEALESTRQGFQSVQKVSYHFDQQHVTALSPTVALATAAGSTSATLNDGRTFNTRFAQSVVLVLTNGQWKVLHAHRSFPAQKTVLTR